jgi:hypothetical protein
MDETQKIISEQLAKLPKSIKDAISSIDLEDKIKKIANKNMLHIDQAGDLINETIFVMLGLEPTSDYKENIRRELNISRDRAQAITADIDKEIFVSIREVLKDITNKKETELESKINHVPLTESEEIKKQVKVQQEVKPPAPSPANLPVGEAVGLGSEEKPSSAPEDIDKTKESHIQKQSPYAKDPYREPVDE